DAWGRPIRLLASAKPVDNPFGAAQFQFHELVSAGPDGKFGTDDDLKLADLRVIQQYGWTGNWWWLAGEERLVKLGRDRLRLDPRQNFGFRRMAENRQLMAMPGMAGGFPEAAMQKGQALQAPIADKLDGHGGPGGALAPAVKVP